MAFWNPWRGCKRCSIGCEYCYIHKGDEKRSVDTSEIVKTPNFYMPINKNKNNEYKTKGNQIVYTCFSSDFLIEEADEWRTKCFEMIKERQDLSFLFLTKRIERFDSIKPLDWGSGYDNVIVGVSVENQTNIDKRITILNNLPIKHRMIICQPLIDRIDLSSYLDKAELVIVGGESDKNARPLNFDWVIDVYNQCKNANVKFEFRQTGSYLIKDGLRINVNYFNQMKMARQLQKELEEK